MEIHKDLTGLGLTEELLLFFHSRTANRDKKISKAFLEKFSWNQKAMSYLPSSAHGEPLAFKVKFEGGSEAEYTLEVAKVRQKRLNLLLMKNK